MSGRAGGAQTSRSAGGAQTSRSAGLRRFAAGSSPTSARPEGQTVPAGPERAGPPVPLPGRGRPAAGSGPEEACEMCAAEIPAEHGHVANLDQSTLMCACRACYLLFTHGQAGRGRFRSVPDRFRSDPSRPLSVADWESLEIPVGLAFFLRRSEEGSSQGDRAGEVTGFYPSPAGATECRLDLQAWQQIAESHPMLAAAAPDVEAILISRGQAGVDCFLVPIDACYELAGRMRVLWRGFDGGSEARASIAELLDGVRSRSRPFVQGP
jgi:Family of unknown function (DUF5947)